MSPYDVLYIRYPFHSKIFFLINFFFIKQSIHVEYHSKKSTFNLFTSKSKRKIRLIKKRIFFYTYYKTNKVTCKKRIHLDNGKKGNKKFRDLLWYEKNHCHFSVHKRMKNAKICVKNHVLGLLVNLRYKRTYIVYQGIRAKKPI